MHISLVSPYQEVPYEKYLLNLLFCEGLEYFHLRKGGFSERQIRTYIEGIPEVFHSKIIIHNHFELVKEYGLLGAHFYKRNTYESFLEKHDLDPTVCHFKRMGFSLNATHEVEKYGKNYDYIFLSPVFDSISNKIYHSKFSLSNLKKFLLKRKGKPEIVALGGVDSSKVEKVNHVGFDGMAMLGYIWTPFEEDSNIINAVKRFNYITKINNEMQQQYML